VSDAAAARLFSSAFHAAARALFLRDARRQRCQVLIERCRRADAFSPRFDYELYIFDDFSQLFATCR